MILCFFIFEQVSLSSWRFAFHFIICFFRTYTMSDYSDPQLTPNGKVSKAKKGKPVHVCTECQKVYTRAEHLRRHQTSHEEPQYQCHICERRFHRRDLLERHFRRHEGEAKPGQDDYQQ
uniref:C2H2-type domain-containing protein n=1 Tax=Gibberella zeae TaxID=5518 RepID=A0A4E9EGN7_GIBZA